MPNRSPTAVASLRLAWTGIGSTHHRDPEAAASAVLTAYPDLPFWPQLPNRAPAEAMVPQAALGLPGARWNGQRLHWSGAKVDAAASAALLPRDHAGGLYALLSRLEALPAAKRPLWAKGQIIGPLTLSTFITGNGPRNALDPARLVALGRFLGEQGAAQARAFGRLGIRALIAFDEPLLARVGDDRLPVEWDAATAALRAAFTPVAREDGLAGVHCCAPADWSRVLEAEPAIIHFDATPAGLERFLGHRPAVRAYLARGGALGWGVWPTDDASPPFEAAAARATLVEAAGSLVDSPDQVAEVLRRSTLTGVCGTAGFTADREQQLAADLRTLSAQLRKQFRL